MTLQEIPNIGKGFQLSLTRHEENKHSTSEMYSLCVLQAISGIFIIKYIYNPLLIDITLITVHIFCLILW